MGSSQTTARTCVPYIGRQILNHCATREVCVSSYVETETDHIGNRVEKTILITKPIFILNFHNCSRNQPIRFTVSENNVTLLKVVAALPT